MRTKLKRVTALVLTALMLLLLLPTGLASDAETISDPVIPGLADGGVLLDAINTPTEQPIANDALTAHTVEFNIGADALAAGVVAPASVTVEDGNTITTLPAISWLDESGKAVKVFAGWYTDAELNNEFSTDSAITANITLFAKWVDPDAEGRYYVNFYSQDGTTVHLTVSVDEGRTVNPATAPSLEGKIFRGWATMLQGDMPVSAINAFDFSTPISNAVTEGEKTLNLYAWYGIEVSVSFVSNGGIAVPTQIIAQGETASNVTPMREGFTFRGWSSSKDEYIAFDFTTPINEDITLYAFWDADLVPVNLVFMLENADDDGYTPAGHSETVYAPAGSYISIEKSAITSIGQTHNVRTAETAGGDLTGYASADGAGGSNATIPDVYNTYFQYASASNNRFVMPDGTTVMLVYYNRVRVTLTFNYGLSSNGSISVNDHISAEDQTKYAVSYKTTTTSGEWESSYNGFTYTFTAKYGQNIVPVWPQVGWVTTTGNFYGWKKQNDIVQVSNVYTLVNDLFNSPSISNGTLVASGTLRAVGQDTSTFWLIYARTTLPGETVDFTYNGKNYTIYSEACQQAKASGYFGYKALDGCTAATSTKFGAQYRNLNNLSITPSGGTMQEKFDAVFPGKIDHGSNVWFGSDGDYCQVLLYNRDTQTLTIIAYDDTYGAAAQTKSYLYGDWIYNEDTDLLKTVEAGMNKANYRFAGWYTDADFTPGTEYVPDENSRITGNMNLYGKWEPSQFLAEFYLYTDDATPYAEQGFAEGGRIENKLVPTAVQENFVGWYWYQNGRLERFDFTSTVGAAHVDENGVLKLYAVWKGTTGKVSYLPGIGGDNATQEVFDSRDFDINAASVEMPSYTTVWPTGVPTDAALTFVGWKAPNGAIYQPGRYVLVTRTLMQFEAQWSKDSVKLIYNANGGNGSDVIETWARNSNVAIWDNMDANNPHFTRDNYVLLGWDENPNATTPTYALGTGSITLSKDTTTLYAIWKRTTVDVTITKQVTGNMGDRSKSFNFTVGSSLAMGSGEGYTLSGDATTATFTLSHDHSMTLKDVPIGATLEVTEEAPGYEFSMTFNGTAASNPITVQEGSNAIVVTNNLDATPDTGVMMDSLPYILILAVVVAIGVIVFIRKRRNRDDD